MAHASRPAGPAPTRESLREAALRHLARFASTETSLARVLERRVLRWGQRAAQEGVACDAVVGQARDLSRSVARELVASGVIDDAAFAAARAVRLARAGRSRRAVAAHLAAKGIAPELAASALPEAEHEVSSALAYARRRRMGPFRMDAGPESRMKDLAALARAGFSREVAEQALRTPPAEAEALVLALKRG